MLICITAEQNTLDSLLSSRFERAGYFIFLDMESRELELVKNQKNIFSHSKAHHLVAEKEPDLVITGNIEPEDYDFLKASGIKIFSGVFGASGRQALEKYRNGQLKETEKVPGAGRGRLL